VAFAETAIVPDPRYQAILDRNAFNLRPPPTNVVPVAPKPPPPQVNLKVQVSGITVGPGGKFAWLVVPQQPGRTNAQYLRLREGESQGDVQVTRIDEQARIVDLVSAGIPTTLDLTKDAPAVVAMVAPTPAANPAAAAARGRRPTTPTPAGAGSTPIQAGATSSGVNPSVRSGYSGATDARTGRTINAGNVTRADTGVGTYQTVPSRPLRTAESDPVVNQDPAIQYLRMRAQEEAARQQGVQLPPTPPIPGVQ
jgi:hypothetical protein